MQSNRYAYWKVAVASFADHPLQGEGSGSFRAIWLREREFREVIRDAHSLYLETAAELGLVGLLSLALLVAGCAVAAVRAGPALPGAAAALAAFALHAGIDWDWELPALTLVALALAATAHRGGRASNPGGCRGGGWPSPMSAWFALRRGTASPAGRSAASSERTKNAFTPADSVWTSA